MKKRKVKLLALMAAATMLVGAFPGTAMAADSDNYEVNYMKGAPTTAANPVDYSRVTYYADGFKAKANTLTGSSNRMVTITSSEAGGMTTQYLKPSNTTVVWKMKGSKTGLVEFKVVASGSERCSSKGIIKINP